MVRKPNWSSVAVFQVRVAAYDVPILSKPESRRKPNHPNFRHLSQNVASVAAFTGFAVGAVAVGDRFAKRWF